MAANSNIAAVIRVFFMLLLLRFYFIFKRVVHFPNLVKLGHILDGELPVILGYLGFNHIDIECFWLLGERLHVVPATNNSAAN